MKNVNVHHKLIFKNVIIISFAYTFAPDLCISYIPTSAVCLLSVCVYCVLSYKIYCAYTPSNGAMALLNKISVFRIRIPYSVSFLSLEEDESSKALVCYYFLFFCFVLFCRIGEDIFLDLFHSIQFWQSLEDGAGKRCSECVYSGERCIELLQAFSI